ncbi:MAG: protease inhibitor Kazal-type [Bacteroidota bacterium]
MKKIWLLFLILIQLFSCQEEDNLCEETKDGSGICYEIYRPIWDCHGKTYGNDCEAESFGITEYTLGACQ